MLTKETVAAELDGAEYPFRPTAEQRLAWREAGLVVVFGASDDLMEFEGAIYDERDGEGTALVDHVGLLPMRDGIDDDDELEAFFARRKVARKIKGKFDSEGYTFVYKTDIPHATFEVMEDGDKYCRGVVFALADCTPQ